MSNAAKRLTRYQVRAYTLLLNSKSALTLEELAIGVYGEPLKPHWRPMIQKLMQAMRLKISDLGLGEVKKIPSGTGYITYKLEVEDADLVQSRIFEEFTRIRLEGHEEENQRGD
jgi:hypothetical protein